MEKTLKIVKKVEIERDWFKIYYANECISSHYTYEEALEKFDEFVERLRSPEFGKETVMKEMK